MLDKLYLSKTSNLFAENRLLKFAIILMVVAVIYYGNKAERAAANKAVVIVPAGLCSEIEVTSTHLPDEYVQAMTRYIISLLYNYTPATVRSQYDQLLKLYSPESFSTARKLYYELATDVESSLTSSVFYINKIVVNPSTIEVQGTRRIYTESQKILEQGTKCDIEYHIANSRLYIKSIKETQL